MEGHARFDGHVGGSLLPQPATEPRANSSGRPRAATSTAGIKPAPQRLTSPSTSLHPAARQSCHPILVRILPTLEDCDNRSTALHASH